MPRIRGEFVSGRIWINGEELIPANSLKVRNHSPTGFSWGYGGSGPAQLSLAILLSFFPRDIALHSYQEFKWRTIARLPQSDFEIELSIYDMVDIGKVLPHSSP
jgi:hypothetical protein